jgi:aryl-alcohol dehydrogenase
MTVQTKAAVLREKGGSFLLEDIQLDEPRPDEVLVRLVATGLCHTDLLVRDQLLPPPLPAVLGHEGSGVVEQVGAAVTDLAAGDRVVLSPISCGQCRNCQTGHPMHCPHWGPLNLRGRRTDGSTAYRDDSGAELNGHFFGQSSFANRVVVRRSTAVKIDRDVPLELLGPLGCGLLAGAGAVLNVLRPEPGTSLLVMGAGAVGLAAVMAAKATGCSRILVFDLHPNRLELALELGATEAYPADPDVPQRVIAATGGGAEFAVDAVGRPQTVQSALQSVATGGSVAVVGSAGIGQSVSLDLTQLTTRSIHGVLEGDSVPAVLIPQLLDLHLAGDFPFDRMIRKYPIEEINQAMADSLDGTTVKPVLLHSAEETTAA